MNSAILFALASAAMISASTLGNQRILQPPDIEVEGRITNGTAARIGQFPYVVGLLINSGGTMYAVCTGSLIGPKWIVTAAHCVNGLGDIHAYLGAISHSSYEVSLTVPNSNAIVHPDWNSSSLHNDIALIRIPAVSYSTRIRNIKLPAYSKPLSSYAGDKAVISGWGGTYDNSPFPENLLYANVTILRQEKCPTTLDVIDSIMCASTTSSSTCAGDSGGPLTSNGTLVGVSSYTVYGCNSGYPAGFSRITSFLWWIKKNTGISY